MYYLLNGFEQYTSHEYLILIYEEILTYSDITETQTYVDSETVTLVYQWVYVNILMVPKNILFNNLDPEHGNITKKYSNLRIQNLFL